MTSQKSAKAMLDGLSRAAREALTPQVDAAAIEAAVMARVARSNFDSLVVPRRRSMRQFLVPAAALAAAAAVAFIAAHTLIDHRNPVEVTARGQLVSEPGMDGALLVVGQVIEANDRDQTVKHRDVATWRLRAPGRIRVVEAGQRITLALDRGRVDAEVIPQPQPEVLAIEVEQLRVAVHGTVFSVERRGDLAEVMVREGKVRVGSTAQPGSGQLLTAPSHVSFDVRPEQLDEPRGTARGKAPPKTPHPASQAPTQPPTAQPEPVPPAPKLERPSSAEAERIWEAAAREIADCFAAQPGSDPNLRVSFTTQVQLRIAREGTVSLGGFDPPVPENVMSCAEQRVLLLQTAPTQFGASINRPKVLTR